MKSRFWHYHECFDLGPNKEYHGILAVTAEDGNSDIEVEVILENNKSSDETTIGFVKAPKEGFGACRNYARILFSNEPFCRFMWKKHKKKMRQAE